MTPEFRPRFPWWGGDLQTLRNRFAYRERPLPGSAEPFEVKTPDGDTLTGTLHRAPAPKQQPFVFLLHGLTGSEDSMYMLESARHHLSKGRTVLRMNLRGAGSSEAVCDQTYSGASWPDVLTVLAALDPTLTGHGVFLVGYSMGGNILINALPHLPEVPHCIGAATVCAPIDPASASKRLNDRRNRVYEKALLDGLKESHRELPFADNPETGQAIARAESIWEFDDTVTAPRVGYRNAQDYYDNTAGKNQLSAITLPLLLIHARNDPWIPVEPYLALDTSPNVTVEITASGGHVGFHGQDAQPWHDLRISDFIDTLVAAS